MRRIAALAIAVALLTPASARGADWAVAVDDNEYRPDVARPGVGDSVHWFRASGSDNQHNVEEDSRLFRSGGLTTGPIDFTVIFSGGTFHYFCVAHGNANGGMDGLVRVPAETRSTPSGLPFTVVWANSNTETGNVFDLKFKVGSGDWRTWLTDTTRFRRVFGADDDPVQVRDNREYRFRVRSQEGGDISRWSPVVLLVP